MYVYMCVCVRVRGLTPCIVPYPICLCDYLPIKVLTPLNINPESLP